MKAANTSKSVFASMASAKFTERALEHLADHDAWRVQHGWAPMALEIYDAVLAYFQPYHPDEEPHFLPGRPAKLGGEPIDLRVVRITVRSKPFQVFYRYTDGVFQIRRVHHPRAQ
jgi:hypothetical protein